MEQLQQENKEKTKPYELIVDEKKDPLSGETFMFVVTPKTQEDMEFYHRSRLGDQSLEDYTVFSVMPDDNVDEVRERAQKRHERLSNKQVQDKLIEAGEYYSHLYNNISHLEDEIEEIEESGHPDQSALSNKQKELDEWESKITKLLKDADNYIRGNE